MGPHLGQTYLTDFLARILLYSGENYKDPTPATVSLTVRKLTIAFNINLTIIIKVLFLKR